MRSLEHVGRVLARDLAAYLADRTDDGLATLGNTLADAIGLLLLDQDGWSRRRVVGSWDAITEWAITVASQG